MKSSGLYGDILPLSGQIVNGRADFVINFSWNKNRRTREKAAAGFAAAFPCQFFGLFRPGSASRLDGGDVRVDALVPVEEAFHVDHVADLEVLHGRIHGGAGIADTFWLRSEYRIEDI